MVLLPYGWKSADVGARLARPGAPDPTDGAAAQVTGESGAGAVLGDFKGRTTGIGWTGAWGRQPVVFGAACPQGNRI